MQFLKVFLALVVAALAVTVGFVAVAVAAVAVVAYFVARLIVLKFRTKSPLASGSAHATRPAQVRPARGNVIDITATEVPSSPSASLEK
ncbi:MAG: hypothetical protein V4773_27895 [Verrucomicrobiota bacterium]